MTRKAVLLARSCLFALACLFGSVATTQSDVPAKEQVYVGPYVPVLFMREENYMKVRDSTALLPSSTALPRANPLLPVALPSVHSVNPSSMPSVADAKAWALALLGPAEYLCLASIIKHEDGTWNPTRYSGTGSGAYGIPQALPGSKMKSAGSDWRTNRITQLKWMIGYVNRRYGSACDAWAFWQRQEPYGWY